MDIDSIARDSLPLPFVTHKQTTRTQLRKTCFFSQLDTKVQEWGPRLAEPRLECLSTEHSDDRLEMARGSAGKRLSREPMARSFMSRFSRGWLAHGPGSETPIRFLPANNRPLCQSASSLPLWVAPCLVHNSQRLSRSRSRVQADGWSRFSRTISQHWQEGALLRSALSRAKSRQGCVSE